MLSHVLVWGRWIGIHMYMSFKIKHWFVYDPLLKDRKEKSCMSQLFLHFPPSKTSPVKLLCLWLLPQDNFCTCCSKIKLHLLKRNCHLGSHMLSNDIFCLFL